MQRQPAENIEPGSAVPHEGAERLVVRIAAPGVIETINQDFVDRLVTDGGWRTEQVQRASQVEFDPETGEHVATDLQTGEVIATSPSRGECIRREVWHFSERLLRGFRPFVRRST